MKNYLILLFVVASQLSYADRDYSESTYYWSELKTFNVTNETKEIKFDGLKSKEKIDYYSDRNVQRTCAESYEIPRCVTYAGPGEVCHYERGYSTYDCSYTETVFKYSRTYSYTENLSLKFDLSEVDKKINVLGSYKVAGDSTQLILKNGKEYFFKAKYVPVGNLGRNASRVLLTERTIKAVSSELHVDGLGDKPLKATLEDGLLKVKVGKLFDYSNYKIKLDVSKKKLIGSSFLKRIYVQENNTELIEFEGYKEIHVRLYDFLDSLPRKMKLELFSSFNTEEDVRILNEGDFNLEGYTKWIFK